MRILVIDDEESIRHMLSVILRKEGYEAALCPDATFALKTLEKEDFDFILCDIRMQGLDGLGFLKELKAKGFSPSDPPVVIMMSAYGTVDTALECMGLGAYDYIPKPFKPDEIILTIKKAQERERLKRENTRLKHEAGKLYGDIYAKSQAMRDALALVRKVADYDTTVLITGETGTGKELIAREIHYGGNRKNLPFIAVNCGALPENLLESELFGHVKGAFTDAIRTKQGLFEEASGGTLFLDEVGELPKDLQVKLLRVLQDGEIRRVGDTRSIKVNTRVIAATARDLEEEIKNRGFREDLYYRLNVIGIKIAPLRERKEEIPGLADIFLSRYSKKYSKVISGIEEAAIAALMNYSWRGNVRELENVIERAVLLEDTAMIGLKNLPLGQRKGPVMPMEVLSIKKAEDALERELIKKALEITNGNKTRAAELLEISHRTLLYKIKDYEL